MTQSNPHQVCDLIGGLLPVPALHIFFSRLFD
jgi:hypothetical protein